MKRKITLCILLILIIMCVTLLSYEKINKTKVINNNGMFAIFLEEEKDSGTYQKSNLKTWPTEEEYTINMLKSYCENGSILRWNSKTKKISLKVNGTDKCYVYFDKAEIGTEKHPHLIQTIEDLVRLSNDVAGGKTYEGEYFLLTNDLDFNDPSDYEDANSLDFEDINGINGDEPLIKELTTGSGFVPIGYSKSIFFAGNFNGNNKKISNIYINGNDKNYETLALFGYIKSSEISNLTVSGEIFKNDTGVVAGLVGSNYYYSIINNCHNYINVKNDGPSSTGGLVGVNWAKLDILNSSNNGKIEGNNPGGIIGYNNTELLIKNSFNKGEIFSVTSDSLGGLIAKGSNISTITIENSFNQGKITSNSQNEKDINLGGLVGKTFGSININNSYNIGEMRDLRENYSKNLGVSIGGLIGMLDTDGEESKITNCYNTGNIYGGNRVGGIIGCISVRTNKTIIDKCYNTGNMSTDIIAGSFITTTSGIIGYNAVSTALILNSFNTGNIKSEMVASGIAYEDQTGILYTINSYNAGNIIGNNYASGLFTSTNNSTNVIYAYNLFNRGLLESSNKYGIFINRQGNTINAIKVIENVYYENSVNASNVAEIVGIPMSINDMKNQTFVNKLNENLESINLSEIDESLKDYKLSKWELGKNGYPTLVNE